MNKSKSKQSNRITRHKRVRAKIIGTAKRPRVTVFRSNKNIFVQLIDDQARKTILSSKVASSVKSRAKGKKTEKASEVGRVLAEKAKASGINEVVFDRGGYKYHGRVKALAEGLREGGLKL